MSRNSHFSTHFLPRTYSADKLSGNSDSHRDMARPREGFLQNLTRRSSKMPTFKYLSSNLSRTILWMESIATPSELRAVSSEQNLRHGILEDTRAKDLIFLEHQSTSGLVPRVQHSDGSSKCALCKAQNQATHNTDTGFKYTIISPLGQSRAERRTHQGSKSDKLIRSAPTETYYDTTRPAYIARRNKRLQLQISRVQSSISGQNDAPWTSSDAACIYPLATTESPTNILYHDFMKEISLSQSSPELFFKKIYPARSTSRNPNPPKDDLITLPAFTVDPSDLTQNGSLKKRSKSTSFLPKIQLDRRHKDSIHNSSFPPLFNNKRHLSLDIPPTTSIENNATNSSCSPQYRGPFPIAQQNPPLTPPMTPATSRANSTSTSQSCGQSIQRHPKHCLSSSIPSLNSSHQHTLLLLNAKDPSRHTPTAKSPPSSKRSRSCSTRMSSSYSSCYSKLEKEGSLMIATPSESSCKTNSILADTLPSLSDVSHLSLSPSAASVMNDTAAGADNTEKDTMLSTTPPVKQQPTPSSNTDETRQHPDLLTESPPHALTTKDNKSIKTPPIIPPPILKNHISRPNQKTHKQSPSKDSILKPSSPPPTPIERSRPIPRLLHPAPWLEEEDGDEERSLKVPYAQSWTEVWAVHDRHPKWKWASTTTTVVDGRRKKMGPSDRVRDGLKRVLGRV